MIATPGTLGTKGVVAQQERVRLHVLPVLVTLSIGTLSTQGWVVTTAQVRWELHSRAATGGAGDADPALVDLGQAADPVHDAEAVPGEDAEGADAPQLRLRGEQPCMTPTRTRCASMPARLAISDGETGRVPHCSGVLMCGRCVEKPWIRA